MSRTTARHDLAAELALVGVNSVAIIGLDRLFLTSSPLRTTVPVLLATHLVLAIGRRRNVGAIVATAGSAITGGFLIVWTLYADTLWFGVPTSTTAGEAGADLDQAWFLFQDAGAPVEPIPGYIVAAAIGAWLIAVLSDWEAFRSRSPIEALVPAFALVAYNGVLGPKTGDGAAILHGAIFVAAAGLFVVVERMGRTASETTWLAGQTRRGVRHTMLTAGLMLLPVVVAGAVAAPLLPGAEADPVLDVRGGPGDSTPRNAVSPLVDIQARLVNQSDIELFRVTTDTPSYWRLMALDLFENDRWRLERGFDEVTGELPASDDSVVAASSLTAQTFDITALADDWVPAAFDPVAADSDLDLLFDPVSSTLLLADEQDELAGHSYSIRSQIPRADSATAVAAADRAIPDEVLDRFTQLPSDFSPAVADAARDVAAGAASPYEQAIALQSYLRAFTYDITVSSGHSFNRIEDFLEVRRGYCEQFATTFAAMARSLGLPSRVAVGFTTGDPTDVPGEYIVRGRHAHAWPEVYLAGVGWSHFEPTPGRGNPASTAINSIDAAQDVSPGVGPGLPTPTSVPSADPTNPTATTPPRTRAVEDQSPVATSSGDIAGGSWTTTLALLAVGLATAALLYVASLWWIRHHGRRRLLEDEPRIRIEKAWQRVDADLRLSGVPSRPSETHLEFSARVHRDLGKAGADLDRLASLSAEASYAPGDRLDTHRAEAAEAASGALRAHLYRDFPPGVRLRTWVDPRLPGPPPPNS